MPVTNVPDGTVVTSTFWHANVRDQVVSTVTSATRPTGTEGQHIVETDTDKEYIYSGSGWVEWGGYGTWTTYTPTLTQSGAVTKTVTYARYFKIGRMVTVNVSLAVTGAGSANVAITATLPFTAATSAMVIGAGMLFDNGGANYPGVTYLTSTTAVALIETPNPTTGIFYGQTGASFAAALAAGDAFMFEGTYESTT